MTVSLSQLLEESFQIAWDYLERTANSEMAPPQAGFSATRSKPGSVVASAAGSRSLIALSAPISVSEWTDLALPRSGHSPDCALPVRSWSHGRSQAWQKLTAS